MFFVFIWGWVTLLQIILLDFYGLFIFSLLFIVVHVVFAVIKVKIAYKPYSTVNEHYERLEKMPPDTSRFSNRASNFSFPLAR